MKGLFLFNKPQGPSSAQFLNQLKHKWHIPQGVRVGHGGTLDPFAEGLLIVGISREYTKQLHMVLLNEIKEYEVEIILGATSNTDDRTGEIKKIKNQELKIEKITERKILEAIKKLKNKETQTPPQYSAVKVKGKAAYARSRIGEKVILTPKKVALYNYTIHSIKKGNDSLYITVTLLVSSGFYIRSFARDLGELLDVGGYVSALKRTKIGSFSLKNALNLNDFTKTMTLYIKSTNTAQNATFQDGIISLIEEQKLPFVKDKDMVEITGSLSNLQTIFTDIKNYTNSQSVEIRTWIELY